eukprot:scaffold5956_cov385-Prasinococcus_capsulatus_cf.AAC.7
MATSQFELLRQDKIERLLRSLITEVSGLQPAVDEDVENFDLALDFALARLKHHNFLEVNPSQVDRQYAALAHRFEVASQLRKGELLQQARRDFDRTYQSPELFPETRSSILSLLYNLADRPLATPMLKGYQAPRAEEQNEATVSKHVISQESEESDPEEFDQWLSQGSDAELSDWDDNEHRADVTAADAPDYAHTIPGQELAPLDPLPHTGQIVDGTFRNEAPITFSQRAPAHYVPGVRDTHVAATVLDVARECMQRKKRAFVPRMLPPTTEEDVVLELLALFLYGCSTEHFHVMEEADGSIKVCVEECLAMRHVSPQSLQSALAPLTNMAEKLIRCRRFHEWCSRAAVGPLPRHCATIQAFAAALNVQVLDVLKRVKILEESLQQDHSLVGSDGARPTRRACTLLRLQYDLKGVGRRVAMLARLLVAVQCELHVRLS